MRWEFHSFGRQSPEAVLALHDAPDRGWDHTVVADQNRSRDGFQAMSVSPVHQIRLDRDNGPNGVGDQNQISGGILP